MTGELRVATLLDRTQEADREYGQQGARTEPPAELAEAEAEAGEGIAVCLGRVGSAGPRGVNPRPEGLGGRRKGAGPRGR